jgi:hypothetical protein
MAGIFLEKYKNNRLTLLKKNSIFLTIRRDILFIKKAFINNYIIYSVRIGHDQKIVAVPTVYD